MSKLSAAIKYAAKNSETLLFSYNGVRVASFTPEVYHGIGKWFENNIEIECRGLNKKTNKREYLLVYNGMNILIDSWHWL